MPVPHIISIFEFEWKTRKNANCLLIEIYFIFMVSVLFCLRWTNKKKRKKKLLTNRFWFSALNTIQSITEQNSNSSRPLAILVSTTSPLPPPQWQRWNSILCTHKVEIRIRTYIYLIHVKFLFALLLLQFFSVL